MLRYLYLTLFFLTVNCADLVAQDSIAKKIIGVWQLTNKTYVDYVIFINNNSGAFTSNTRLLRCNFSYELTFEGQSTLIIEHLSIYNDKQYAFKGLISLKNDSTLIINSETNGKKALLIDGKKVSIYKKLTNESIETFIRKPNQADLIGTWISAHKKDTTMLFTFKSNNTVDIKVAKTNKTANTIYRVNFNKQPMTLDLINTEGAVLPNIFVFQNDSILRLAGPKNGQRRKEFTVFGNNLFLEKIKE